MGWGGESGGGVVRREWGWGGEEGEGKVGVGW